jgi:hypothetical protein
MDTTPINTTATTNTPYFTGKWGTIYINTSHDRVRITRRGKNHKGVFVTKEWVSLIVKPDNRIRIYMWRPSIGIRNITYTEHPIMTMMYVARKAGFDLCQPQIEAALFSAIRTLIGTWKVYINELDNIIKQRNFRLLAPMSWEMMYQPTPLIRKGLVMCNIESACKLWLGSKKPYLIEFLTHLLQPRVYQISPYQTYPKFGISPAIFALIEFTNGMRSIPGWGNTESHVILRNIPKTHIDIQSVQKLFAFLEYSPIQIAQIISNELANISTGERLNNTAAKLNQILQHNPQYTTQVSGDYYTDSRLIDIEFSWLDESRNEDTLFIPKHTHTLPTFCTSCKYFDNNNWIPCAVNPCIEINDTSCNDYHPIVQ